MKIAEIDFEDERALIRVDFNVPLNDQMQVTDDTRIRRSLPTINYILSNGGAVILMSHLGRPKDGPEDKFSLKHLVGPLSDILNRDVQFAENCIGEEAFRLSSNLLSGDVLLLENLRFYKEEEKGDEDFAEKLAKHGDIYVNDAFGTAHRAHASTATIAKFFGKGKKCFGKLMAAELENAQKVLEKSEAPFTAIIGGAKVSTKIDIIQNMLDRADNILIGGGMAYTFYKAMGGNVGSSLVEDDKLDTAKEVLAATKTCKANVVLPIDSLIADAFSNDANKQSCPSGEIPEGWMGLDIGAKAIQEFSEIIKTPKPYFGMDQWVFLKWIVLR
ncbi:MAG: phosphoglycerate kinase [Chitinophagales bacterium]